MIFRSVILLSLFYATSQAFHFGRRIGGSVRQLPGIKPPERIFVDRFTQNLDHFDPTNNQTFQQMYYVNDEFYQDKGPVFLYIGGEGAADTSWLGYGSMADSAKKFNAMIFELEHRYYGGSRPTEDLSTENLRYLSSEQAIADLAVFVQAMKLQYNLTESKWIAFGGSYAGSLAVWVRSKYPHLVDAAVSHSGPLLAKLDFLEYLKLVGDSLMNYDEKCAEVVKEGFSQMEEALHTNEGRQLLNDLYPLCTPVDVNDEMGVSNLFETIADAFSEVVQYASVGSIERVCDDLTANGEETSLERLRKFAASHVFMPYCLNYNYTEMVEEVKQYQWTDASVSSNNRQWTYQVCTEFGFFQTSSYSDHIFGSRFNVDFFVKQCEDIFGPLLSEKLVRSGIDRTNIFYGGIKVKVNNVVYVHGSVDPWHALGITETVDEDAPAIYIEGASHCAGMNSALYTTDPGLKAAVDKIDDLIAVWLQQ